MGFIDWSSPSIFLVSYRSIAMRNGIIYLISFFPVLFLIYAGTVNRSLFIRYRTNIIFSSFIQFWLSLPQAIFFIWFAVFTTEPISTSVFLCTTVQSGMFLACVSSYLTAPAQALFRFLVIVCENDLSIRHLTLIWIIWASPNFVLFLLFIFIGFPFPSSICNPFLALRSIYMKIHGFYLIASLIIGILLNLKIVHLLIQHKKNSAFSSSSSHHRHELNISYGIMAQSIIPSITVAFKYLFTSSLIYGVTLPSFLSQFLDGSAYLTVGVNIFVSCLFLKPFRHQFISLVSCGRYGSKKQTGTVKTVDVFSS